MKKLLLGSVALAALVAGPTMAADVPVKARPLPPPPPVYNWTGFYIGANAGGAWGTFDTRTTTVNGADFPAFYMVSPDAEQIAAAGVHSIQKSGFTGGFEAGYNVQAGNLVFGLEGDIGSFRLSGSAASGPIEYLSAPGTAFTVTSNASTTWLATARGRVGVAANNWLFFATGGAAFTNLNANFAFTDTFAAAVESSSFSKIKTGYAVGGGVEVGFWGHWSVKAEYLYVHFGQISAVSTNLTTDLGAFPQNPFTHSVELKASIARVGLNYRFNGPIVARY